ncbi:MAG TPA: class I SAM-dependent methyltransferase [Polyangia bacterium]
MAHKLCPWWLGYFLASPVRRLWQDPRGILQPYVTPGMKVLEPGPGMGFFTLELARLVGPQGRVVAIDVQPRMLSGLQRRAARAGLAGQIECRQAMPDRLGTDDLQATVDFVLAFALVHELPDQAGFFAESARALKTGAGMLVAEPTGHVSKQAFEQSLALADKAGLSAGPTPRIRSSHAALLRKRG